MGVGVVSSWEIRKEDDTESRSSGKSVDGWFSGEDNREGCKGRACGWRQGEVTHRQGMWCYYL